MRIDGWAPLSLVIAACTAVVPPPPAAPVPATDDAPVMRAGPVVITWGEWRAELAGLGVRAADDPRLPALRDALVDRRRVLYAADRAGLPVAQAAVRARVDAVKAERGADGFAADLARAGLTEAAFTRRIAEAVRYEQAMAELVFSRITLTEAQLRDDYAELEPRWRERVRARQIVLPLTARAEAEALREKLAAREIDFTEAARRWSIAPEGARGGDLGLIDINDFPPVLGDVMARVPLKTPSAVIATPFGLHILEVTAEAPSRKVRYEQARPVLIRNRLDFLKREAEKAYVAELARSMPLQHVSPARP